MLAPGLVGNQTLRVTDLDTASSVGSGEVRVLATPRVLALAEAATVAALAGELDAGSTSVGTRVELDHLAPSPVGAEVEATAELVDVTDRRLTFTVRVTQDGREVARGQITRAVVARARYPG